jgi:nitrate/nitrite-specific signal transduction histidine kinase
MEIMELYILGKTLQHTHTTLHCIYYTLHLSVYLLTSTSTDANRTLISLYTLPHQTYDHESLGEKIQDSILHHHK